MKKTLIGLGAMLLLIGMVGTASASTIFTIGDIVILENGNTESLTWSTAENAGFTHTIEVGDTYTFAYGTFSTSDFSLDSADRNDNDDSLTAAFNIVPPDADAQRTASLDAGIFLLIFPYLDVDFNNNWTNVRFGAGNYDWRFNDLEINSNGTYNLTASIRLNADNPVPEPGTMLLLGSGLVGLVGISRRKLKKA